jgi:ATP-dependent RNA helicase DDX56/DBP9
MKRKFDDGGNATKFSEIDKTEESKAATFSQLGLDPRLIQAMAQQGFRTPTVIQQQAIPPALNGRDVLAKSKTGSGKTLAFVAPVIQSVLRRKQVRCSGLESKSI